MITGEGSLRLSYKDLFGILKLVKSPDVAVFAALAESFAFGSGFLGLEFFKLLCIRPRFSALSTSFRIHACISSEFLGSQ